MKTKIGFEVLKLVDIPDIYLLPQVKKELEGREMYADCDDDLTETIYSGDVFEAIACEIAEEPQLYNLSKEALKQIDDLAADLTKYELIRLTQV